MRYAVGFKTHVWDPFIARQLERYRAIVGSGDLFVIADETRRPFPRIDGTAVIRTSAQDLVGLGLADAFGKGGLIWWNTDYPNYKIFIDQPDYDYYVFGEYDTCVNRPLEALVAEVAARGLDLVTLPTRQDLDSWYWTKFHEAAYPRAEIRGSLNCFAIFSRRAMQVLLARRRAMALDYAAGRLSFWPGNEVFVPTEIARAGMNSASLSEFGDASAYEWHPPHLEDDLPKLDRHIFLHPVLDEPRFIQSVLKFEFDLSSYFVRSSPLRRQLARFPARSYVPQMPGAFRRQVTVKLRQALGHI
jgi:hypothetical protein